MIDEGRRNIEINELKALIQLLDDPDESIYRIIMDKIIDFGPEAIPYLEEAWESDPAEITAYRLEDIIHKLHFKDLLIQFENWVKYGSDNLLLGTILLSRFQYPELSEDEIIREMGEISQDIWLELNDNLNALEKIRVFNQVFFHKHGFTGNKANFHSPDNSFLKKVFETRKGNPITLLSSEEGLTFRSSELTCPSILLWGIWKTSRCFSI
jgi:hypothetical protein